MYRTVLCLCKVAKEVLAFISLMRSLLTVNKMINTKTAIC